MGSVTLVECSIADVQPASVRFQSLITSSNMVAVTHPNPSNVPIHSCTHRIPHCLLLFLHPPFTASLLPSLYSVDCNDGFPCVMSVEQPSECQWYLVKPLIDGLIEDDLPLLHQLRNFGIKLLTAIHEIR